MSPSTKASEVVDQKFKWGKKKAIGGKQRECQFYGSFTYNNIDYSLYDSVLLHKEGEPEPYIGKLVKIWEQEHRKKKVKVLWFFRPVEITNFLEEGSSLENELLLASGDGKGLADINNLEAISGKCNVVCTSNDERNPQPSEEELKMADYIFYRTFDVGKYTISDKIDDKIAGVDVKFLLNRNESSGAVKEGKTQTTVTSNEVPSQVKDTVPDSSAQKMETEAPMVAQELKAKAEPPKTPSGQEQSSQKIINPVKPSNGTALKAKAVVKKETKHQKVTSNEVPSQVKDSVPDSSAQKMETEAPVAQEQKAKAEPLQAPPGLEQSSQKKINTVKPSNGTALKAKPVIKKESKHQKVNVQKSGK